MGKNNDTEDCAFCKKNTIRKNINFGWLQCDSSKCNKWYHGFCVGANTQQLFLELQSNTLWFCPQCVSQSNLHSTAVKLADSAVSSIQSSLSDNGNLLNDISTHIKTEMSQLLTSFIDGLKNEMNSEYGAKVKNLNQEQAELRKETLNTNRKLSFIEKRQMQKNIIIKGIPRKFNIHNSHFVLDIAKELQFNLTQYDIDTVYRFKLNSDQKASVPVVVSFVSQLVKDNFLKAYFNYIKHDKLALNCLRTEDNGILYINEHLDINTHKILVHARLLKSKGAIEKVSIKYGKVFIIPKSATQPVYVSTLDSLSEYDNPRANSTFNNDASNSLPDDNTSLNSTIIKKT